MKFLELKNELKDFPIFSLNDIKNIDPAFHRRRLNEWQDKGYIKKIIRGYYLFSDIGFDEEILFKISNQIYYPSYVSLESAFSYYNLIPESIYGITAISTRKTYHFNTTFGEFSFRSISPPLFFGYHLIKNKKYHVKIASIEKALLDYFYLHPNLQTASDFDSLRINKEALIEQVNEKKMNEYLKKYNQKKLIKTINNLWRYIKNVKSGTN
ncbi:MAG: type IV toxin-antitoxin system AbiEi family antitoxin domain-containing protein [Eubacteriaceae bacterium]